MPALIVPSPALIVHLPVNRFPNKLAPNVPNSILKNVPFCFMASFLIVSLIPSIINTDPLSYLLVFLISFISSLKVITLEKPDPNILL